MEAIRAIERSIGVDGSSRAVGLDIDEAIYGIFNSDNGVNGEIDEGVFQGGKGDCWLISGVLSLSYTEDGAEIIKNAISENEDDSYSVYFAGIDKTYTITQDELDSVNVSSLESGLGLKKAPYSTGDDDLLLIELAVEKVVEEGEYSLDTVDGITGGSAFYLYQLFVGSENVDYTYGAVDDADKIEEFLDYLEENDEETSAVIGVEDGFAGLEDCHAYAVKSYDGETMTLVNPWNSTGDIEISTDELLENIGDYDISIAYA